MTALFSTLFSYEGILGLIYGRAMETGFTGFLLQIGWLFCLYLFALLLGYLITTLYYRMDSKRKVLVSVSVPVLLVLVLPLIDTELFQGRISQALSEALKAVFRAAKRAESSFWHAVPAYLLRGLWVMRRGLATKSGIEITHAFYVITR